jgi:DNA-directed RNA polymerase specialized sigma24 family protein
MPSHNRITITSLPAIYQRIVYLRDVKGMRWLHIAAFLDMTLSDVQKRYERVQIEAARTKRGQPQGKVSYSNMLYGR